jgi:hypothetical protein
MQIPSNSTDPFIKSLAEKGEKVRSLFLEHVNSLTKKVQLKVMLGDGTVSDQESFDPVLVRQFYDDILRKLPNWTNQGVSASTDKDLRRSFIKFEIKEGNYLLSAYMSLQYHALLFYKLDHKVIEIQKELAELTDKIKELQENIKPESDKLIEEKLKQKGYENMDHQKLFEVLFENDEMTKELAESMRSTELKINDLIIRRDSLFQELDNKLIEVYHTSSVMIDEIRMIAAEEGCLCNFNLEYVKNNSSEGSFNPIRIPAKVKEDLSKHMDDLVKVVEF